MMWVTKIQAIDPIDNQLKEFFGPNVPGATEEEARLFCKKNSLGYCAVYGMLVSEHYMDEHIAKVIIDNGLKEN